MSSSISVMDSVISALGLTSIDAGNPRTPLFFATTVPVIGRPKPEGSLRGTPLAVLPPLEEPDDFIQHHLNSQPTPFGSDRAAIHGAQPSSNSRHCPCPALAMQSVPDQARSTPLWMMVPKWDQGAPYETVRREEGRRLAWSALQLVSGDIAVRIPSGAPLLDLKLVKPQNVSYIRLDTAKGGATNVPFRRLGSLLCCILARAYIPNTRTSMLYIQAKSES